MVRTIMVLAVLLLAAGVVNASINSNASMFSEEFPGTTLDTAKWQSSTSGGGTVQVSGNALQITSTTTSEEANVKTIATFPFGSATEWVVEAKFKVGSMSVPLGDWYRSTALLRGLDWTIGYSSTQDIALMLMDGSDSSKFTLGWDWWGGPSGQTTPLSGGGQDLLRNTWYKVALYHRSDNSVAIYLNDVYIDSKPSINSAKPEALFSGDTSGLTGLHLTIEYVRVGSASGCYFGWASQWYDSGTGIPLQTMKCDARQGYRQFVEAIYAFGSHPNSWLPEVSSYVGGGEPSRLVDGDTSTAWSSASHTGPNYSEWFQFWYSDSAHDTSNVWLRPRMVSGQSYCVPEWVDLYYHANSVWNYIGRFDLPQNLSADGKCLTFDVVNTNGFRVSTDRLRTDEYGVYRFQMAEASGGYSIVTYDLTTDPDGVGPLLSPTACAQNYAGKLYVFGDEPDCAQTSPLNAVAPKVYAAAYHDFVEDMLSIDPTAKFSPAGFAQASSTNPPASEMYGFKYADKFYADYVTLYGVAPPVREWRFHVFSAYPQYESSMQPWTDMVAYVADWAVTHGAPLYLGSFGFPGVDNLYNIIDQESQMLNTIYSDNRIIGANWWSFDDWNTPFHSLANPPNYDNLTGEGDTYVNFINSH